MENYAQISNHLAPKIPRAEPFHSNWLRNQTFHSNIVNLSLLCLCYEQLEWKTLTLTGVGWCIIDLSKLGQAHYRGARQ
jgi:hypothetical protein